MKKVILVLLTAIVSLMTTQIIAGGKGDPTGAEEQIRNHLRAILADLPATADARPEFFEKTD